MGVGTTVDLVGCGTSEVLLAGPAIRALAGRTQPVVLLVDPDAEEAAALLPGVADVKVVPAPADQPAGPPAAVVLRPHGDARGHDVERLISAALDAGGRLPADDDGRLHLRAPLPDVEELVPPEPYVVLHPGARDPARCWPAASCAEAARLLLSEGWAVVVTGGPGDVGLTARVAAGSGSRLVDLGGLTSLAELAAVLAGARAVVAASTAAAQLGAAAGTPVVALLPSESEELERRVPYGVPSVLLELPSVTAADVLVSVGKLAD